MVVSLMLKSITLALVTGLVASQEGTRPESDEWPTRAWPSSYPQAEGVDAEVLEAIHDEIRAGRFRYVDSMLVIRNGRIVAEHAYEHDYVSATKGKDEFGL